MRNHNDTGIRTMVQMRIMYPFGHLISSPWIMPTVKYNALQASTILLVHLHVTKLSTAVFIYHLQSSKPIVLCQFSTSFSKPSCILGSTRAFLHSIGAGKFLRENFYKKGRERPAEGNPGIFTRMSLKRGRLRKPPCIGIICIGWWIKNIELD